jgi:hypothetical protein
MPTLVSLLAGGGFVAETGLRDLFTTGRNRNVSIIVNILNLPIGTYGIHAPYLW